MRPSWRAAHTSLDFGVNEHVSLASTCTEKYPDVGNLLYRACCAKAMLQIMRALYGVAEHQRRVEKETQNGKYIP
jgi:hypothetical protein